MAESLFIPAISVIVSLFAWLVAQGRPREPAVLHEDRLEERIDSLLPQTQCGKCDYAGCRPYARAIARGEADINRCPPGGRETVDRLAELLGRERVALLSADPPGEQARVAIIDENLCIGCVKCIQVCPVDAIIGAAKQMHTVVNKACTGCELCIPPCPMDCISMVPVEVKIGRWIWTKPLPDYEAGM